jgi:hypothetical protein
VSTTAWPQLPPAMVAFSAKIIGLNLGAVDFLDG